MRLQMLVSAVLLVPSLCLAQAPPARAVQGPTQQAPSRADKMQMPGYGGDENCDALKQRVAELEKLAAAQREKIKLLESQMAKGGTK